MADIRQILTILGMTALLFFGIPIRVDKSNDSKEQLFLTYITKYNKSYRDNTTEYHRRFKAFQESLALIEELNKNRTLNSSALYGLTRFSDMSHDEFNDRHLKNNYESKRIQMHEQHGALNLKSILTNQINRTKRTLLPQSFDWRTQNVVTPVYNQKLCGACWAFSTIEVLESMRAIQTGILESLSVQEAIDCSGNDNEGCEGGDICSLLQWMFDNNVKIAPEPKYPLKWKTGMCPLKEPDVGVSITEFECKSYTKNEKLLLDRLANHGPVAVAVNALTWQNYLGGVIQYHCDSSIEMLNHAVQLVGYDLTAEIPYYIARNSWGTSFGEKGYLKLAIGSNMCGLAHEVGSIYL